MNAKALPKTSVGSDSDILATKGDVTILKIEAAAIKSEIGLIQWMLIIIIAGVLALVTQAFL